jgi:ParB family chromosome partitioning protein
MIAGLDAVPVIVKPVRDELALAMALIENIQREDLNPIEEAAGIRRLVDEFGMTHEAAADAVGRSRSAVSNLLRLLSLPEPVQQLLHDGKLDMGHARALLTLPAATQIELAQQIAVEGLSARQAEQLAIQVQRKRSPPSASERDGDVLALEEELSDILGTRVALRPGPKGTGRVIIDYGSLDQLDVLLTKLRA